MLFIVSDVSCVRRRIGDAVDRDRRKRTGSSATGAGGIVPSGLLGCRTSAGSATGARTHWRSPWARETPGDRSARSLRRIARLPSSSSLDQVTKALVARSCAAARERRRSFPGFRPDARAKHRRGVRDSERRRVSVQDGRSSRARVRGTDRCRRCMRASSRRIRAGARSGWR